MPILPALAQEGGGILFTFGIDQRLEAGNNLNLETPSEGSTTRADTKLSFGILSETGTQSLSLDLSGLLRFEKTDQTGSDTGFQDPDLRFGYSRLGAHSALDLNAYYRETDVNAQQTLSDLAPDGGPIVLPGDFGNLTGSGTRLVSGGSVKLQLGIDAPLGFVLDAGLSKTSYANTSNPNLTDFDRKNLDGQARLRFSDRTTGTLGLHYDSYDNSDPAGRDRVTRSVDIGLEQSLSPRLDLTGTIGVSEVESDEAGGTTTESGLIGSLGLNYAMPNGTATADFDADLDETGNQRLNLVFGRSLDLPDGALALRLGVTLPDSGGADLIGSLDWQRALPAGTLSARIDRSVSSSDTDVSRLTTLASLNYDHDINAVSGLGLGLLYIVEDGTGTSAGVTRTDLNATYRHALTEDWNLNTGISYRMRDEDAVGTARAPSVFVSIGRRFEFRP